MPESLKSTFSWYGEGLAELGGEEISNTQNKKQCSFNSFTTKNSDFLLFPSLVSVGAESSCVYHFGRKYQKRFEHSS